MQNGWGSWLLWQEGHLACICTSNPRGSWGTKPSVEWCLGKNLVLFPFQRPFSRWTWVNRYQTVSILDFILATGDGGGGSNWSNKTCKAPVKISPQTNQHLVFAGSMAFLSPNQQCQRMKGESAKIRLHIKNQTCSTRVRTWTRVRT